MRQSEHEEPTWAIGKLQTVVDLLGAQMATIPDTNSDAFIRLEAASDQCDEVVTRLTERVAGTQATAPTEQAN